MRKHKYKNINQHKEFYIIYLQNYCRQAFVSYSKRFNILKSDRFL